jgi:hypothetical protein
MKNRPILLSLLSVQLSRAVWHVLLVTRSEAAQGVAHGLWRDIDERHLASQRSGEAFRHLGMGERLRVGQSPPPH